MEKSFLLPFFLKFVFPSGETNLGEEEPQKPRKCQQKKVFQDFDFLRKKDFGDENQSFSKIILFLKKIFWKIIFEKALSPEIFSAGEKNFIFDFENHVPFQQKKISSPGGNLFRDLLFSP